MTLRFHIKYRFLLICMVLASVLKAQHPNIIYIMADDHAADAIGIYNGRLARLNPTPNIDQLANKGTVFTNVFCNNSICTPSRASIITGQYSQTNEILDLDDSLKVEKQFLPIELKKLGYSTAIIGKWHLKNEPANFDYYKVLPAQGKYFDPIFREKGKGTWPDNITKNQGHSSDVITNSTIDYIKGLDKSKPFFIMHHFKAPHGPFQYAPRYEEYLKDAEIPEPVSLYSQPKFGSEGSGQCDEWKNRIGSSVSSRFNLTKNGGKPGNYAQRYFPEIKDEKLATHLTYQQYIKEYLRCVKGVDDNLGKLFEFLKKEGLWDNTIIIYTADQGMLLGEHDFVDKRWMYDPSMRMPFIIKNVKGKTGPETSDLLINNTDFAPTMIELAGGKTPAYMQGMSFKNTLESKEETNWRTATYYRYWMHMIHHFVPAHIGIRTKDYKLIFFYGKHYLPIDEQKQFYWFQNNYGQGEETPHSWEFYDLRNDPEEMHNRYNDAQYKGIIDSLKVEMKRQRELYHETDEKYPEIKKIIEENWN